MCPWFSSKHEGTAFIRETAEGLVAGTVDPNTGANAIWHTAAMNSFEFDLRPLQPLIDAGDRLDLLPLSDPRRPPLEAEVVRLAGELLADEAFWAQGT